MADVTIKAALLAIKPHLPNDLPGNALKGAIDGFLAVSPAALDDLVLFPDFGGGGGGGAAPAAAANPINPLDALQQVVTAVRTAEKDLEDKANLHIAQGTIDLEMAIDVGGVAGAQGRIHLEIAPKPYT